MRHLFFGEFSAEVDEARCHGVFRGLEPVGLSDVPRKVLFALLEHRPRPVSGKALLHELWPAGANPSNVAKQIRSLRVAIGDERAPGLYIRTVNKEGYAFVMPVTEAPAANATAAVPVAKKIGAHEPLVRASLTSMNAHASSGFGISSTQEWALALEKLKKDFRGSCLHDLELLYDATKECDQRIQLIATHKRFRLHARFAPEPVFASPQRGAGQHWAAGGSPDADVASSSADLIRYAKTAPVVVNVGSYAPACIAVLQSLRRRYGLDLRGDAQDLSGRQQVIRLTHNDEADFLFAPHAPLVLVGEHYALDYRWIMPVHEYEQAVLRISGSARGRKRKLLVYKGGSPEEQLISRVGIPSSSEAELVGSLEKLLAKVQELRAGDMVIAWEPLASGLESTHDVRRIADFRCWLSLYCHKRWQRGALRALKDQFSRLFVSEWMYCRRNNAWAIECLAEELRALEYFAAGSGLGARV